MVCPGAAKPLTARRARTLAPPPCLRLLSPVPTDAAPAPPRLASPAPRAGPRLPLCSSADATAARPALVPCSSVADDRHPCGSSLLPVPDASRPRTIRTLAAAPSRPATAPSNPVLPARC
ncbi:hypothetical protein ACJRO7_010856 [Eucalyptus globulus]|uniref:Uncharacterized protein n=1 Tax=Eucalyptus globulus TaxID=34317 RepID=A0ABD3LGQ0_EUCGL